MVPNYGSFRLDSQCVVAGQSMFPWVGLTGFESAGGAGLDAKNHRISPLRTRDHSGLIQIESPVKRKFSLREFFSEWQVNLLGTASVRCALGTGRPSPAREWGFAPRKSGGDHLCTTR